LEPYGNIILGKKVIVNQGEVVRPSQLIASVRRTRRSGVKPLDLLGIVAMLSLGCAPAVRPPSEPRPDPHAPATLSEALDRLRQTLPPDTIQQMRDGTEADMVKYHMGLGLWMRNNWGLWARGPLYQDLAALGLRHPDDMSGVILTSLWRELHGRPLGLEAQVAKYKEYWRLATPPEPHSNRACSGPIETTLGAGEDGVHMGTCCADGLVWSYHVDRGWYRPTDDETAMWNRAKSDGMYDPCKK
jgi:hypothetical protein